MPWFKLGFDKREMREFAKQVERASRFYTDADVPSPVVEVLRHEGYDVECAKERGLAGHSDDFHFKRAAKAKRILLTHDHDYLDHITYPLNQTWGVCILDVDRGDAGELGRALTVVSRILGGLALAWRERKIVVNSDYTLRMYRDDDEDGITVTRYRLDGNEEDVWMWEDDEE